MQTRTAKRIRKEHLGLDELRPGLVIAEDIWNNSHTQVMVGKDTVLDSSLIERLERADIYEVPIQVEDEGQALSIVDLSVSGENSDVATGNGGVSADNGAVALGNNLETGSSRRVSLWQKNHPDATGCAMIWSSSPARRNTAARALVPLGLAILEAGTPQEVFQHLQDNAPSILVVDLRFSEGQNWDLLASLPETAAGRLPLVILSDSDSRENVLIAKKYKARAYLIWPQAPENFRSRIAALLNLPCP